jgi:hypothetical protein
MLVVIDEAMVVEKRSQQMPHNLVAIMATLHTVRQCLARAREICQGHASHHLQSFK